MRRASVRTGFGEEFLGRSRNILAESEALAAFAAGHGGRPSRALRFGLIPTVAPYLLPEIYPALRSALPDVGFTVSESRTDPLLQSLEAGTLDLALIATPLPENTRLTATPLHAAPICRTPRLSLVCRGNISCCSTKAIVSAIRRSRPAPCAAQMLPA